MTEALEDHEGIVSTGGRAITHLRFADDIDGLAGEEKEASRQSLQSLRYGDQCREDQADDKQHQWHQHRDQSNAIISRLCGIPVDKNCSEWRYVLFKFT